MHSERSGDGHSPPGVETCSPGNFYMLRDQIRCSLAAQTVHILPLICWYSTVLDFRLGIAGNNRVAFVAK